jgi:hypothetical protein
VVGVDDGAGRGLPGGACLGEGVVDQGCFAAPVDGPADHLPGVQVEHDAAVDLALAGRMLGDVGEPQLVGRGGSELALDEVLAGGGVLEVLDACAWSGQAADPQLAHDLFHQLGVHDQSLLDLQGGPDPQAAVGAPGPGVDVGDGVGEQQAADLAVVRPAELDVVVGGAVQADYLAGEPLGVAQVVQPSDNLELSFGPAPPSSNKALAAFTALSSASSSLIRRRACSSGLAS